MSIPTIQRERRHSGIEPLEARIAPAVTALDVGRALDLLDGTAITLSGHAASFATLKLSATGQLLGFPSGGDGDFLVLSTGVASQLTSLPNSGSSQGTDLGAVGADGDSAAVSFTVPVPSGPPGKQRFKLDFMFLTEEYPEFAGAADNDVFTVTINGTNYAVDGQGNLMSVDNNLFIGAPATGTYFDGRTDKITLTYAVPEGVTSLNVEIRITDVGDGQVDSAVLLDNVRFQTQETMYLDFDGATLIDHFGAGISVNIPAFAPEDIGSSAELQQIIDSIIAKLEEKFAAYDINFTTSDSLYGAGGTIVIGGNNGVMLDLTNANPLVQARFPNGQGSVSDVFGLGDDALLGLSGAPDIGNTNHNDQAVIFSGEFSSFFSGSSPEALLDHLVVTIAHEVGHNLGLRHLTDANPGDVMSQTAPRSSSATFGSSLLPLAEEWSDGVTDQNDHAYLLSILGPSDGSGTGLQSTVAAATMNFFPRLTQTLYDVTIHITTGDEDVAGIVLHFNQLDGSQNLALPLLPFGAEISIVGSSTPGGPADIFSGVPVGGLLSEDAHSVPLFDADGTLADIAFAKKLPSGMFVVSGSAPLLSNSLGNVKLMPTKVITLTDEDGDFYTIKLTGPGLIGYALVDPDLNGKGSLARISLEGTTLGESILTITVSKQGPNGDGRVEIGEITGTPGAGLKSLSAPLANFTGGGIVFSGALGSVSIRDLMNGADLIAGTADGVKTTVRLHEVGDGSEISLGTDIALLQAARIGDASITVPSLARLYITGDKVAGLAPDLAADVKIAGLLGSLTIGDLLATASIEAGGSPLDRTVLAMRSVADGVSVSLASAVTSLRATAIGDADFNAQSFASIILTGLFGGDLTAIDKIGRFVGRDVFGTASITAGGLATDKTALVFQTIHSGAAITLESSISTLRAVQVNDVSITAASIGTFLVTGNLRAGLAGDFQGNLSLEGGDEAFKNTLGNIRIVGGIYDASISAESIGTFTAGRIANSTVFAGFTPANSGQPMDGGVFFDGGSIRSFVIRSATDGFDNSVVAASSLGTLRVLSIHSDNGGTPFGFLTKAAPTRVSIAGFTFDKAGPPDQSVGDFHLRIE